MTLSGAEFMTFEQGYDRLFINLHSFMTPRHMLTLDMG